MKEKHITVTVEYRGRNTIGSFHDTHTYKVLKINGMPFVVASDSNTAAVVRVGDFITEAQALYLASLENVTLVTVPKS